MNRHKNRLWKYSLVIIAFSIWMWWDISQAHSNLAAVYQSFFPDAETKTTEIPPATIAIVRSNDAALTNPCDVTTDGIPYATVAQMVRRACDLAGGLSSIIKSGDTVLIKPNLVQQDSSGSGGVTDVRVVKALVYLVDEIDHGKIKIIVGDGSPRAFTTFEKASGGTGTTWTQLYDVPGYQILKTEALASGIDFRISNLNGNSDTNPWPELDSVSVVNSQALPQNGYFFVHHDVTQATVYISVPVMKVHEQPGYTGALKNQIGIAASTKYGFNKMQGVTQEGRTHKLYHQNLMSTTGQNWQDKEIVDLSVIAKIKFSVVDAITCLETQKSPKYTADRISRNITNRVVMNTIVAGKDPVAVDNVCCRIMGINPDDIEHITLAERVGLGTNNSENITVAGASIDQTKRRFKKSLALYGVYGQSNRVWMLNGPYSASGVSDMNTQFISSDSTVGPTAGLNGWSQPYYFTDDQIMLKDFFGLGSTGQYVSYAFTYFTVPKDTTAELWIGSDEAVRVYLNEHLVYNFTGTRTFAGTDWYKDTSTVLNLKAGVNKLLLKIYQSTGTYNFSLNICELCDLTASPVYRGNRLSGLKFTPNSDGTSVNNGNPSTISSFELKNSFPNPFNPTTTIRYSLSTAGHVKLDIYDLAGRKVATLVNETKPAGTYNIPWNASHLSSGVYFSKLTAGKFSQVKKMVLIK
jgi:uncharacterized protein (DUF362 family)